MGVREKPMIANRRARQFCAARPYSAGTSLRRDKSPEAPKITMVQGSAGEIELFFAGSTASKTAFFPRDMFGASLFRGRFDRMAAKLIAHRGQQLVRIRIGIARSAPNRMARRAPIPGPWPAQAFPAAGADTRLWLYHRRPSSNSLP